MFDGGFFSFLALLSHVRKTEKLRPISSDIARAAATSTSPFPLAFLDAIEAKDGRRKTKQERRSEQRGKRRVVMEKRKTGRGGGLVSSTPHH